MRAARARRLQAGPASPGVGSAAGHSTPAARPRPRPCSAWPRGTGTTARQGHPKPSAGPGRAGVGGGPPGPPMGSGCRCGGATSRRRTPSWTPSSASLRARVSGGGAGGPGTGRGASSSQCDWGGGGRGRAWDECICQVRAKGAAGVLRALARGRGGRGLVLGAAGPGVGAPGGRLIQSSGTGRVCDAECAGQGDGMGVCSIPHSGCLDVEGCVGAGTGE